MNLRCSLKNVVAGSAALLLLCAALRLTAGEKIIAVGDRGYPPLEYLDDAGIPTGFNVDIFKKVMEQMHLDYEIHLMDWNAALDAVRTGKADMFIDLGYSDERAAVYAFAPPHNYLATMIVSRK